MTAFSWRNPPLMEYPIFWWDLLWKRCNEGMMLALLGLEIVSEPIKRTKIP